MLLIKKRWGQFFERIAFWLRLGRGRQSVVCQGVKWFCSHGDDIEQNHLSDCEIDSWVPRWGDWLCHTGAAGCAMQERWMNTLEVADAGCLSQTCYICVWIYQ